MDELIEKYNVSVPRYTSYPTVPNWRTEHFSKESYEEILVRDFHRSNRDGLSIYIHLPYCESLCTYCGCNTRITVNHAVEGPYIDSLLKEWELYLALFGERPRIKEIHLGGGTPTFFSPSELSRLIESITDSAEVLPEASFSFEAHPANTSEEHLRTLRSLGFDRLSLGVQDFDPIVQKAINRRQKPEDVERVNDRARELGYRSVNFDLVYGLPFQTLAGLEDAVNEVIRMRPDRLAFYSYAHVPWKRPGQRAYDENDLPPAKEKLALFVKGREMLLKAGYESIGFDHFALPSDSLFRSYQEGKMHRNFMGYTDLRTSYLIGLGASSISDIGVAFSQNAKSVEAYRETVGKGSLPIVKGHILDEMETIIRKHILNLTCQHKTSWSHSSSSLERDYMMSRLEKLGEVEIDEMIKTSSDSIELTERGKLFVRNICAVLDRDYQEVISEGKYSKGV